MCRVSRCFPIATCKILTPPPTLYLYIIFTCLPRHAMPTDKKAFSRLGYTVRSGAVAREKAGN